MTEIALNNLGKKFGNFTALADMNLTIGDGEFMALLGPSGCGKSTTMNMIAGMLQPSEGDILFDGRHMNNVAMARRGVGFVFQNYAIFTHMSVYENLAYGLRAQRKPAAEIDKRVKAIAELLQLTPMLNQNSSSLSVNILQRLAIGRSAIVEPSIFLLDEPLSNVDAAFRAVMRSELKELQKTFNQTMVYVTHDQLEAMTMADRIAVMDHGKLLQVGTPLEVYHEPENTFVARFIGAPGMNIFTGQLQKTDQGTVVDLGPRGLSQVLPEPLAKAARVHGETVQFGFRPEQIVANDNGRLQMPTTFVERIGARTVVHLGDGDFEAKAILENTTATPKIGDVLRFDLEGGAVRLFTAETGQAIRGVV